jgi:hypothetical protein
VFCLPARAQIPLHDHPGMTVLSRVLYGTLHVESFDWCSNGGSGADALPRQAMCVLDGVRTPSDPPGLLLPESGGNLHQFTALTDCAVLDCLSPPYDEKSGK